MRECGVEKIADKEHIEENSLKSDNETSFQQFRFFNVEENEQMESFIICFL